MLFNSIDFAIYLPVVFILYWFVFNKNLRIQNAFLVVASYVFYGWWDWRFLSLIIFSSSVDYLVGLKLGQTDDSRKRKLWLLLSITVNLGFLGFFKYYNFFVENFVQAFRFFGAEFNPKTLNIVLPVGISFYTFQTMSYSIDVYRRKLEPTKDIIAFFAYVSFFPQLVAGPIERATNLLPQFLKPRTFDYEKAKDGLRQMLWGLFKKIVIADNAAQIVDKIFANYPNLNSTTLILGAFMFAFQIYGDFSGYSDVAIGTARLFGFNLMRNFAYPYFSRDIAEFWRRWHISLSSWFRDYVYIPLGGSRVGTLKTIRNVFIIFIVSGFWHGANWTFIAWGALNAAFFLPLMLSKKNRRYLDIVAKDRLLPNAKELWQMGITFFITLIAWVFFRSQTIGDAILYIKGMFSDFTLIPHKLSTIASADISGLKETIKYLLPLPNFSAQVSKTLLLIIFMLLVEWMQRDKQHGLEALERKFPVFLRWSFYFALILMILWLGGKQQQFIYFQF